MGRAACHAGIWVWARCARLGQRCVLHPGSAHRISCRIVRAQAGDTLVGDHRPCLRHHRQYHRHPCWRRCRADGVAHYPGRRFRPYGRHRRHCDHAVVSQGAPRSSAWHLGCVGRDGKRRHAHHRRRGCRGDGKLHQRVVDAPGSRRHRARHVPYRLSRSVWAVRRRGRKARRGPVLVQRALQQQGCVGLGVRVLHRGRCLHRQPGFSVLLHYGESQRTAYRGYGSRERGCFLGHVLQSHCRQDFRRNPLAPQGAHLLHD